MVCINAEFSLPVYLTLNGTQCSSQHNATSCVQLQSTDTHAHTKTQPQWTCTVLVYELLAIVEIHYQLYVYAVRMYVNV